MHFDAFCSLVLRKSQKICRKHCPHFQEWWPSWSPETLWLGFTEPERFEVSAHGIEIKEPSAHDITKIFTKVSISEFEIWSHPEKMFFTNLKHGNLMATTSLSPDQTEHQHISLASTRLTPTLRWFLPRSPRPSPHIKTTSQQWTFRSMKVAWNRWIGKVLDLSAEWSQAILILFVMFWYWECQKYEKNKRCHYIRQTYDNNNKIQ